ncbi:hypothetical protein D3C71_77570 [compost metagenome]
MFDKLLNPSALLETNNDVVEAFVSAYHIYVLGHPSYPLAARWNSIYDGGEFHDVTVELRRRSKRPPLNYITRASSRQEQKLNAASDEPLLVLLLRGMELLDEPRHVVALRVHRGEFDKRFRRVIAGEYNTETEYVLDVNHELISAPSLQTMARVLGDVTLAYMNHPHTARPEIELQPGFTLRQGKK